LLYEAPPSSGALRQGEIIEAVWEHRVLITSPPPEEGPPVESILHPRVIMLTADCDLEQDFRRRYTEGQNGYVLTDTDDSDRAIIPCVLLCDLYVESEIKVRIASGSDIWKPIPRNASERYHRLPAAQIADVPILDLPDLYSDFKKAFAVSTTALYQGVLNGHVRRIAIVPPIYVHDLMHRFYSFLSRVGLPD